MKDLFKFEIHLNEQCNLNCKGCDHFSPISEREFADINVVEKDLKRMSELIEDKMPVSIYLLGGEPLLNPEVTKYCDLARKYFPNKERATIRIVTNGILLDKQGDEFWKCCQKNDILIAPSRYKLNLDYESIMKKAKEYNVKIEFFHSDNYVEYMYCVPLDLNGSQNKDESFKNCIIASRCAFLKEGKIYSCPRVPNIYHFNKKFNKDLKISENDYIDIFKIDSFDDILHFLEKTKDFCRYCDVKNISMEVPWGISKNEINEWTL